MYITFWYQVIAECCVPKISYSENKRGSVCLILIVVKHDICDMVTMAINIVYRHGKTTLLKHISSRVLNIPPNIDLLLCEQGTSDCLSTTAEWLLCWPQLGVTR